MDQDSQRALSEVNVGDDVECVRLDGKRIVSKFVGFVRCRGGMLANRPNERYYVVDFKNGRCVRTSFIRTFRIKRRAATSR